MGDQGCRSRYDLIATNYTCRDAISRYAHFPKFQEDMNLGECYSSTGTKHQMGTSVTSLCMWQKDLPVTTPWREPQDTR